MSPEGLDNLMTIQERLNHIISQTYLMVEWNIKPRLVRCPRCKKEIMTDIAGPKCDVCGLSMVTVIK